MILTLTSHADLQQYLDAIESSTETAVAALATAASPREPCVE